MASRARCATARPTSPAPSAPARNQLLNEKEGRKQPTTGPDRGARDEQQQQVLVGRNEQKVKNLPEQGMREPLSHVNPTVIFLSAPEFPTYVKKKKMRAKKQSSRTDCSAQQL